MEPVMINEKIKKQVLKLSSQERAELAHLLIDSLHQEKNFESEKAWSKELMRRIDRYEQDESSSKPWSDVKKMLGHFSTDEQFGCRIRRSGRGRVLRNN